MKNLRDMVREISNKIQIIEGREKGENSEIVGKIVTIVDYDFIRDDEKEYVVYIIRENPDLFFFGGKLLSEQLRQLDQMGARDQIKNDGLPMKLIPKKSLKGRTYYSVEFYPGE